MPMRLIFACILIAAIMARMVFPSLLAADHPVMCAAWIRGIVGGLGMAGPLALIGFMMLAIVASPIPSGPIAVAAGALYGTF
jgi:uncharacterized membrane protein YdjX (TVP38/TMEM64 family)